jgi:membrane associated rhomboid family serine protease
MTQPGGSAAPPVAHCYRHPNREALVRCTRCDRPICPDCMRPASVGFHCPDDVDRAAKTVRRPRTSIGAALVQSPPYVTFGLIALNVAAYIATGLGDRASLRDPTGSKLFYDWQLSPYAIHDQHKYYQLVTSMFLHLNVLHIGVNMLSLFLIGPAVEAVLGRWRFLTVYLLCGLGGSVAVYAFGAKFGFTAGASGAIFGLFGVCLLLHRKIGLDLQWLIGTLVLNFVLTFSIANISKLGHIGGFVTGLLAGLALGGLPAARERIRTPVQLAGLGGLLVLVVVIAAVRTATW